MFFQNVAQLERIIASPKQPQSVTGFLIAIQRVSGVIAIIRREDNQRPSLKLTLVINSIPARNSAVIKAKDATKANSENQLRCITSR